MNRVSINPKLFVWARERSGIERSVLVSRFHQLPKWESGDLKPTSNQLEVFAQATLTPFGSFFLPEPPDEKLPLPDFRTLIDSKPKRPTAALLETIYQMQRRQEWLRDYLIEQYEDPIPFIGTVTLASSHIAAAESMRKTLCIPNGWAETYPTWTDALVGLRHAVEDTGVLVVINGIFGNNTSKKLDPEEFRGFVLCDKYAPLIFINGADAKSAQMFTLAHELAHLLLGSNALFNLKDLQASDHESEKFCNQVAAEFLIPQKELLDCWPSIKRKQDPYALLARRFKVSPIVAARRLLDSNLIEKIDFFDFLKADREKEFKKAQDKAGGGDFFKTQNNRIGHRFGGAVVRATRSGKLLYQEAYRLTGLYGRTFDKYSSRLGFTNV